MGGMACGLTMFSHDVVHRLQQATTRLQALTLLRTQPSDTVIWMMTSVYSVRISPSFISIHHTVHKHIYSLLTV